MKDHSKILLCLAIFLSPCSLVAQTTSKFYSQQSSQQDSSIQVTASEYCDFLNYVAASDPYHLYDEQMTMDPDIACITRVGAAGRWHYEVIVGKENEPITYVNWLSEARYCNWLQNSKPTVAQDATCTEKGAYDLNGSDCTTANKKIFKNPDAKYFISDDDQNDDLSLKSSRSGFEIIAPSSSSLTLASTSISHRLSSSSYLKDIAIVAFSIGCMMTPGDHEAIEQDTVSSSADRNIASLTLEDFRAASQNHPTASRLIIHEDGTIQPREADPRASGRNRSENITIRNALRKALLQCNEEQTVNEVLSDQNNHQMISNPSDLTGEIINKIFKHPNIYEIKEMIFRSGETIYMCANAPKIRTIIGAGNIKCLERYTELPNLVFRDDLPSVEGPNQLLYYYSIEEFNYSAQKAESAGKQEEAYLWRKASLQCQNTYELQEKERLKSDHWFSKYNSDITDCWVKSAKALQRDQIEESSSLSELAQKKENNIERAYEIFKRQREAEVNAESSKASSNRYIRFKESVNYYQQAFDYLNESVKQLLDGKLECADLYNSASKEAEFAADCFSKSAEMLLGEKGTTRGENKTERTFSEAAKYADNSAKCYREAAVSSIKESSTSGEEIKKWSIAMLQYNIAAECYSKAAQCRSESDLNRACFFERSANSFKEQAKQQITSEESRSSVAADAKDLSLFNEGEWLITNYLATSWINSKNDFYARKIIFNDIFSQIINPVQHAVIRDQNKIENITPDEKKSDSLVEEDKSDKNISILVSAFNALSLEATDSDHRQQFSDKVQIKKTQSEDIKEKAVLLEQDAKKDLKTSIDNEEVIDAAEDDKEETKCTIDILSNKSKELFDEAVKFENDGKTMVATLARKVARQCKIAATDLSELHSATDDKFPDYNELEKNTQKKIEAAYNQKDFYDKINRFEDDYGMNLFLDDYKKYHDLAASNDATKEIAEQWVNLIKLGAHIQEKFNEIIKSYTEEESQEKIDFLGKSLNCLQKSIHPLAEASGRITMNDIEAATAFKDAVICWIEAANVNFDNRLDLEQLVEQANKETQRAFDLKLKNQEGEESERGEHEARGWIKETKADGCDISESAVTSRDSGSSVASETAHDFSTASIYEIKAAEAKKNGLHDASDLWTKAVTFSHAADNYCIQAGNNKISPFVLAAQYTEQAAHSFSQAAECIVKSTEARTVSYHEVAILFTEAMKQFKIAAEYREKALEMYLAGNKEKADYLVNIGWAAMRAANSFFYTAEHSIKIEKSKTTWNKDVLDLSSKAVRKFKKAATYYTKACKNQILGNIAEIVRYTNKAEQHQFEGNRYQDAAIAAERSSNSQTIEDNEQKLAAYEQLLAKEEASDSSDSSEGSSISINEDKAVAAIEKGEDVLKEEYTHLTLEEINEQIINYTNKAIEARKEGKTDEVTQSEQAVREIQFYRDNYDNLTKTPQAYPQEIERKFQSFKKAAKCKRLASKQLANAIEAAANGNQQEAVIKRVIAEKLNIVAAHWKKSWESYQSDDVATAEREDNMASTMEKEVSILEEHLNSLAKTKKEFDDNPAARVVATADFPDPEHDLTKRVTITKLNSKGSYLRKEEVINTTTKSILCSQEMAARHLLVTLTDSQDPKEFLKQLNYPEAKLEEIRAPLYYLYWGSPTELPQANEMREVLEKIKREFPTVIAEPDFLITSSSEPDHSDYYNQWSLWKQCDVKKNSANSSKPEIRRVISEEQEIDPEWIKHNSGLNIAKVWEEQPHSDPIVIAIIDTGINSSHQNLRENMWSVPDSNPPIYGCRYNFAEKNLDSIMRNYTLDDHSHGTHVAGIVGATPKDGQGIAGVARGVKLMACKFLHPDGRGGSNGRVGDLINCIHYACDHDAEILNLSFGFSSSSLNKEFFVALHQSLARVAHEGRIIIVAAGNGEQQLHVEGGHGGIELKNDNSCPAPIRFQYPINGRPDLVPFDNMIVVAATTETAELAIFSNYGEAVHITSPGANILSTSSERDSSTSTKSGTSMAAPYIAAAIALMKTKFPTASYEQLFHRLFTKVDSLAQQEPPKYISSGRLNLVNVLQLEEEGPFSHHTPTSEDNAFYNEIKDIHNLRCSAEKNAGIAWSSYEEAKQNKELTLWEIAIKRAQTMQSDWNIIAEKYREKKNSFPEKMSPWEKSFRNAMIQKEIWEKISKDAISDYNIVISGRDTNDHSNYDDHNITDHDNNYSEQKSAPTCTIAQQKL